MKLFIFYPDTYVRCNNSIVLLVGLHNGKYILERNNSFVLDNNATYFEISKDTLSFVEKCMSNGLGYTLECTTYPYIPQKKLHVVSSIKRTSELLKFAEGFHTKDLLRELHILTHNHSYQAPSDYVYAQIRYPILGESVNLPFSFITDLAQSTIRSIVISGDVDSYMTSCLFAFARNSKHITLRTYGNHLNLDKVNELILSFPNINIEILVDSIEMLINLRNKINIDEIKRITIVLIIKDINNLNAFVQFPYKSKIFIPILYNTKQQQSIIDHMLLDVEDILETRYSSIDIYKKQMIHPNNYGTLLLDCKGNVFNCLKYIGNIHEESIFELLNKYLHSSDCLWYATRREKKGCCNCIFVDLCPPLSVYEFQGIIPYACKKLSEKFDEHPQ